MDELSSVELCASLRTYVYTVKHVQKADGALLMIKIIAVSSSRNIIKVMQKAHVGAFCCEIFLLSAILLIIYNSVT